MESVFGILLTMTPTGISTATSGVEHSGESTPERNISKKRKILKSRQDNVDWMVRNGHDTTKEVESIAELDARIKEDEEAWMESF